MAELEELKTATQASAVLNFEAWDVTGTHFVQANGIQATLPVASVAASLAASMQLPENVPWALRDDRGSFLDETRPIGDQVEPDSTLVITPKTHLG